MIKNDQQGRTSFMDTAHYLNVSIETDERYKDNLDIFYK
jgi:hypothetical protein